MPLRHNWAGAEPIKPDPRKCEGPDVLPLSIHNCYIGHSRGSKSQPRSGSPIYGELLPCPGWDNQWLHGVVSTFPRPHLAHMRPTELSWPQWDWLQWTVLLLAIRWSWFVLLLVFLLFVFNFWGMFVRVYPRIIQGLTFLNSVKHITKILYLLYKLMPFIVESIGCYIWVVIHCTSCITLSCWYFRILSLRSCPRNC